MMPHPPHPFSSHATPCPQIIADKGSVQRIPTIPEDLRDLYKTVWEVRLVSNRDVALDRFSAQ